MIGMKQNEVPRESRRMAREGLPHGLADVRTLPDPTFLELWDSILGVDALKDQLLAQALFNFTARRAVSRATLPLHGVIMLAGPPGTGKTSLAKGLAARVATTFPSSASFRYVEVDPHGLSSGSLGKTQRAVTELFAEVIAEQATLGPTVVLLDEVETIFADRAKLSLEANPIDVHRATDAALIQLDQLAASHPELLFVATSNFPQAIDGAFFSRADIVLEVPPPNEAGRLKILRNTLEGMADVFAGMQSLASSVDLGRVVDAMESLDGRAIRKVVAAACTLDKRVALDPGLLTLELLVEAAQTAVSVRGRLL